jgi:hypothetical protein
VLETIHQNGGQNSILRTCCGPGERLHIDYVQDEDDELLFFFMFTFCFLSIWTGILRNVLLSTKRKNQTGYRMMSRLADMYYY